MIEKVKVLSDQNIVDLALQEYGSVEGLVSFAKRNSIAIDADPDIDSQLDVETLDVVKTDVREHYIRLNYSVATGRIDDGIFDDTFDDTFE